MYHDMGNLNCTFFTRKSGYDRRRNLDIVSKAIQSVSNLINVRVNERDDIVVNAGWDPKEDRKVLRKLPSLEMIYFKLYDVFQIAFYSIQYQVCRFRFLDIGNSGQIGSQICLSPLYCAR